MIIINNLSFLVSHRLPVVRALIHQGFAVSVICGSEISIREDQAMKILSKMDIDIYQISLKGKSINIIYECLTFFRIVKLISKLKPDIIHGVSPKGVLYSGLIGRMLTTKKIVLSFSGLGSLYSRDGSLTVKVIRVIYEKLLVWVLKGKKVISIVQNKDDKDYLVKKLFANSENVFLIKGSGVNFSYIENPESFVRKDVVLFPARVILEKGILQFLEASEALKEKYPNWKFLVAGELNNGNQYSLSKSVIDKWNLQSNVEFLGHVDDIYLLFKTTKIVCLPSYYREGLPLALAEAAAHGCVIITTDNIGCRDTVLNGQTGLLVPSKNVPVLISGLDSLLCNEKKLQKMGQKARIFAENNFDINQVVAKHLEIYAR
ncbi:glycosyltransferase family 4 protein [Amylibacter sp.]|nr:glycosyltransferase family 4 protein [Amylibacter sp.]